MKILLSKIKPSPYQIRSKMNGQSLEELTASIAEIGLAVPIKVRPKGKVYELVYGHRRLTAVRDLGWKEIEAIVEDLTDEQAMLQGLAENVQRDDLTDEEQGFAYKRLVDEFGWTQERVAQEVGKSKSLIGRMILFVTDETTEILRDIHPGGRMEGVAHKAEIIRGATDDPEKRKALASKVVKEDLSRNQTIKVAQSVKEANTDKLKKHLIETEFDSFTHDPERIKDVVEKRAGVDPTIKEQPKVKQWEKAVADFLRYIKQMRWWVEDFEKAVDGDQLSPEAKPFVATRLKTLRNDINRVLDKLEE